MLYKKFKADRTAELVFNIVSNRYFGFTEQTGMVIASKLAVNEWGWVGYEEFSRSRGVLSKEAEGRGG